LASIVENEIRDNDDARSRMHTVVDAILEECRTMSIEPTLGNMLKNEECLTEALSRREITGEDLTAMWCRAEDVAYASSSTTSSSGDLGLEVEDDTSTDDDVDNNSDEDEDEESYLVSSKNTDYAADSDAILRAIATSRRYIVAALIFSVLSAFGVMAMHWKIHHGGAIASDLM